MRPRKCADCSADISNRGVKAVRCLECQTKRDKQKQREYHIKSRKGPQTKVCPDQECGKTFITMRTQTYCCKAHAYRTRKRKNYPGREIICRICELKFTHVGCGSANRSICSNKCRQVWHAMKNYGVRGDAVIIRAHLDFKHCESCGTEFAFNKKNSKPHIDHDHVTGAFRGVICGRCNLAAGFVPKPRDLLALAHYVATRTPVAQIRTPA
jgi:hypothetical protein